MRYDTRKESFFVFIIVFISIKNAQIIGERTSEVPPILGNFILFSGGYNCRSIFSLSFEEFSHFVHNGLSAGYLLLGS